MAIIHSHDNFQRFPRTTTTLIALQLSHCMLLSAQMTSHGKRKKLLIVMIQ